MKDEPMRGRPAAPRFSHWLPLLAKIGGAVLAAAVLAVIGATAGAKSPAPIEATLVAPPLDSMRLPPRGAPERGSHATAEDAGSIEPSSGILPDGRIVLNLATEDELTKLPGVGPSRARAIVALRQRLSKFRAVEDLLRVKGIGRKTLRRIKPNVVLDRPAADKPGPPANDSREDRSNGSPRDGGVPRPSG
jgi:competence protein ComEA